MNKLKKLKKQTILTSLTVIGTISLALFALNYGNTPKVKSDWLIPNPSTNIPWNKSELKTNDSHNYNINWQVTNDVNTKGVLNTTGKLYQFEFTTEDPNFDNYTNWIGQMVEDLQNNGWAKNIYYKEFTLNGIFEDKATYFIRTYLKNIGDKVVSYTYWQDTQGVSFDPSYGLECPCNIKIGVFVSNPVDLNKMLVKK